MYKTFFLPLKPVIKVALPAAIFLLTGFLTVYRQGYGFHLEKKIMENEETHSLLQAMEAGLEQELVFLKSRSRVMPLAKSDLGLEQPTGDRIVILEVGIKDDVLHEKEFALVNLFTENDKD